MKNLAFFVAFLRSLSIFRGQLFDFSCGVVKYFPKPCDAIIQLMPSMKHDSRKSIRNATTTLRQYFPIKKRFPKFTF